MNEGTIMSEIFDHLKNVGVTFGNPLSEDELNKIEAIAKGKIPSALRSLLSNGVPINGPHGDSYARWDLGIDEVFNKWDSFFFELLAYNIQEGGFWHPILGDKPNKIKEAQLQAVSIIKEQPKIIPIEENRVGVIAGLDDGPVIDYYGPLDSTGWQSLYDYFYDNYPNPEYKGIANKVKNIHFWGDIFGWNA